MVKDITITVQKRQPCTCSLIIACLHTHLSEAAQEKSVSTSPSSSSSESSSSSLLSFLAFLDLGSSSPALLLLAGRFPFPFVSYKISIISEIKKYSIIAVPACGHRHVLFVTGV